MVADGENVDPVVKKIIRQVHWELKLAFLIHFCRWNIISATSTYRGTSSFRRRPSLTTAGWILFFFFRIYSKYFTTPVLTFYCFAPNNTMLRLPWRPCWSSSGYLSYPRYLDLLRVEPFGLLIIFSSLGRESDCGRIEAVQSRIVGSFRGRLQN